MLRLAAPLALAELGWMTMGIVDSIMAGRIGAASLGAGSLGTMVFYPIVIAATGMLLGMDTLVAQAHGANDRMETRRSLIAGLWVGIALTPVTVLLILGLMPLLRAVGTTPRVMELLLPYTKALCWGIGSLMLFAAFRRYLQALDIVKPVMFALVSANLINVFGNWLLMYGHWGFRAMGLEGSGWSTSISRFYMAGVLLIVIVRHEAQTGNLISAMSWRPDLERIRRLAGLGLPAALQMLFEGAVFGIVTVFAGTLDEVSLAAHSIAVQVIATTFMVPLGISSAAAVRVGQAAGRKDSHGAARAGWTGLLLSTIFMGTAGICMALAPRAIVRLFIADTAVVASGGLLVRIAALFELFDGFQIVSTGALRGLGDTRSAMIAHLVGYWLLGIPIIYVLCYPLHWGVTGIWVGLTAALMLIGSLLVASWKRAVRGLSN
ncbi:MAG TPA: MATE family efflux transporter [Candidatus Sulfopaludibacter sp.]|jgi:MATE family multidrug resistance protein|nr:MATE family efflux transporter [Candidatus Sulfopaludibacter sp.]